MKSAVLCVAVVALLVQCHARAAAMAGERDWEAQWGWEDATKADSHEQWEHIVRRSAAALGRGQEDAEDDTTHIVDVQEYYRDAFSQGWDEDSEQEARVNTLLSQLHAARIQGGFTEEEREHFQKEAAKALGVSATSKPIQGRYIAMFQQGTNDYVLDRTVEILTQANAESHNKLRAEHISTIRSIRKGLIATLSSKTALLLQKHPLLDTIEVDSAVRRHSLSYLVEPESQSAPTWNLDRLDQHDKDLDGQYLPEGDGSNVDIYIIDTGVRDTHEDLKGRVQYAGYDAIDDLTGTQGHGKDCNGHGTHCAGTAAGTKYGVAKKAEIYNLRALDCGGTGAVSGIVKGIDKIVKQYSKSNKGRRIVISQSLGVPNSESLNTAVREATAAGLVMVGAAGNQGEDSCHYSPPSARVGIAVGATDQQDKVVTFSNTGECMDVFAPGKDIKSAGSECDTCTRTLSGTSMATPHAAGYSAILLSLHPDLTPAQVKQRMIQVSSKDKVVLASVSSSLASKTQNRLLYVPRAAAMDSDVGHTRGFGAASVQSVRDPR